jgi:hypothetical protein
MAKLSSNEINHAGSNNLDDERGVDVAQIQAQLRMSVPERLRTMVAVANAQIEMREASKNSSVVD